MSSLSLLLMYHAEISTSILTENNNKLNDRLQYIDSSGNSENRLNLEILKTRLIKGDTVSALCEDLGISDYALFGYVKKLKDEIKVLEKDFIIVLEGPNIVNKGDRFTINASTNPADIDTEFTYKSSDSSVISINKYGVANALMINEVIKFNSSNTPTKMGTFSQYDHPHTLRRYAEIAEHLGINGENDLKAFASEKKALWKAGISDENIHDLTPGSILYNWQIIDLKDNLINKLINTDFKVIKSNYNEYNDYASIVIKRKQEAKKYKELERCFMNTISEDEANKVLKKKQKYYIIIPTVFARRILYEKNRNVN